MAALGAIYLLGAMVGGALLFSGGTDAHESDIVAESTAAMDEAIAFVSNEVAQQAPAPDPDDPFVIKRVLPIEGPINWGSCHSRWHKVFPAVTTLRPGAYINFLASLVGIHRKSWHRTVEISIARVFRLGRAIRAAAAGTSERGHGPEYANEMPQRHKSARNNGSLNFYALAYGPSLRWLRSKTVISTRATDSARNCTPTTRPLSPASGATGRCGKCSSALSAPKLRQLPVSISHSA